jgi:hypothetical protein
MKRIATKAVAAAAMAGSTFFGQFSVVRAETTTTTWRQLLTGDARENVIEFTVPSESVALLQRKGFHVSKYDTRNLVSRFSDPTFLNCTNNAGLVPIAKFGPGIVGAALGADAPDLVAPTLDTALDAADVRSYRQCETDWLQRIDNARTDGKFEIIDAALGQIDTFDSEMTANFLDLQDRTHELQVSIGSNKLKIKTLQDALDKQGAVTIAAFNSLTDQARDNKRQLDKIVDAQEKARRELELRAQLEEKRQLVQGSAAALSLVAKLAFGKDPVAAARIDTGISSVAKITDSVLQLSSGVNMGAKLILSANMAGAALSIISMFGPQNSETAMMQQQLSAIKKDISELRQDMDERFDRIESMLINMTKYIDQRLATIDQRLTNIEDNLRNVNKTLDVLYKLTRESFNFLISQQFEESARECARPLRRAEFSADRAFDCVEASSRYARNGANKFAISSGSLFDLKADIDTAAGEGASLPPIEQVGYLDAVLREADQQKMLKNGYAVAVDDLVSPPDWATAVDNFSSFIARPEQFQAFKTGGIDSKKLVDNYKNDIVDIINIGEAARSSIEKMRRVGVEFALDRLSDKVSKLADLASNMVVQDIDKRDLSILSIGDLEYRAEMRSRQNTDFSPTVTGDWAYGILFSTTKYFYVQEGQQKSLRWEGQWRVSRFDDVQRTYDSRVPRARYESDWLNWYRDRYSSLLSGGALTHEYDRTIMDLRDRLPEVNDPYLEKQDVGHLTPTAKTDFFAAYSRITSLAPHELPPDIHPTNPSGALQNAILIISPDDDRKQQLQAACDDLSNMRSVVSAYAGLIRTSFTEQDAKWRIALSELPETAVEICGTLLKTPSESDTTNQNLAVKEFMVATIKNAMIPKIEALRSEFQKTDQTGGMDMIDTRLRGLRTFTRALMR